MLFTLKSFLLDGADLSIRLLFFAGNLFVGSMHIRYFMLQYLYLEPDAVKRPNTYGLPLVIFVSIIFSFYYYTAIHKSKALATDRNVAAGREGLAVKRITSLPPVGASLPPFLSSQVLRLFPQREGRLARCAWVGPRGAGGFLTQV